MKTPLALLLALSLAACASGPKPIDTVKVPIKEAAPLPEWAKATPAIPPPADLVSEHLERESVLEAIARGYECRVKLLIDLDLKRAIDPDSCK